MELNVRSVMRVIVVLGQGIRLPTQYAPLVNTVTQEPLLVKAAQQVRTLRLSVLFLILHVANAPKEHILRRLLLLHVPPVQRTHIMI